MYCVHMYRIIHPVLRMQSVEILFFQNNVTNSIAMDMFSCLRNGGNWLDLGNFIKSLINLAASVACFSETTNKAETSIRSGTICDGSAKDSFLGLNNIQKILHTEVKFTIIVSLTTKVKVTSKGGNASARVTWLAQFLLDRSSSCCIC